MKNCLFISLIILISSCSGNTEQDEINDTADTNAVSLFTFDTYNEKISYCIGLDHARGCYNAYSAQNVADKFNIRQIEFGMIDYLAGNDLRISFLDKDSLLDLYLLESGEVDDSQVSLVDASYCVGLDEAFTLVSSLVGRKIDQTVDVEFMINGVKDGFSNTTPAIPYMDARREMENYYSDLNKTNGAQFLAENKLYEGVVETESGLQYEIIKAGTGKSPNVTDSVTIHYTGRHIDGRVFETTIPSNIPFKGSLMSVILGWQEGVMLMKEGGQSRLYIPYTLAYGEQGKGRIEPYSTLIFDIELLEVKRFQ